MPYTYEFKEEAKKDIVDSAAWYRNKSEGLDIRFIDSIEVTIKKILQNPDIGIKVYKDFRQISIKNFPFLLVYEVEAATIIIYTVFHTSRNPKRIIKRLKK